MAKKFKTLRLRVNGWSSIKRTPKMHQMVSGSTRIRSSELGIMAGSRAFRRNGPTWAQLVAKAPRHGRRPLQVHAHGLATGLMLAPRRLLGLAGAAFGRARSGRRRRSGA